MGRRKLTLGEKLQRARVKVEKLEAIKLKQGIKSQTEFIKRIEVKNKPLAKRLIFFREKDINLLRQLRKFGRERRKKK